MHTMLKCAWVVALVMATTITGGCFNGDADSKSTQVASEEKAQNVEPITSSEKVTEVGKLQYPVVNTGDKEARAAINADIEALVADIVAKEDQYTKKDMLTYDVKLDNDDVVAILFKHVAIYEGAAHPMTTVITRVYDKHTGRLKPLTDYVDITMSEILKLAEAGIYNVDGAGPREWDSRFKEDKIPKNFYPDKEGNIWLVFQPYQMTNGVEGASAVKIPAGRVKK